MSEERSDRHFSSDTISVQSAYRPGCVIEMEVTVKPEAVQAAYQKAVKEVRKDISLPGFRKGHVPEELLHKHFEPQVMSRTQTIVTMTAFTEAVDLVGRQPFTKNSIRKSSLRSCSRDTGAEIHFEYEAAPHIPTVDISSLNIEEIPVKLPSEQDVEELYTRLRFLGCEKRPIEGQPVADGNAVKVAISAANADAPQVGEFFVHHGLIPEWLYSLIIGMNVEETKECSLPAPSPEKSPSSATVKILQIFECLVPEENDDFAKKMGAETIADLKRNIRVSLEYEAKRVAQEKMRRQVRNELIRLYAFDLPQSLVEGETEARFRPYWDSLSEEAKGSVDKEAMRKKFLDEVKRYFTCFLLLQPLFPKVKPSYTNAELMDELNYQATKIHASQSVLYPKLREEEVFDRLFANIIVRQCEDYCIEQRLGVTPPRREQLQTPDIDPCLCHEEGCSCQHESH